MRLRCGACFLPNSSSLANEITPFLQAVVHELDVVAQNGAVGVAPLRRHLRRVEAVERRLHAAAIGEQRGAPGLIGGIVDIRGDHLAHRHGAVPDRLQQLIDDRHLRRVERRHAGPVQDEASARAREQAENDGMLAQDVALKDLGGIAVELEHRAVERQDVVVGDRRPGWLSSGPRSAACRAADPGRVAAVPGTTSIADAATVQAKRFRIEGDCMTILRVRHGIISGDMLRIHASSGGCSDSRSCWTAGVGCRSTCPDASNATDKDRCRIGQLIDLKPCGPTCGLQDSRNSARGVDKLHVLDCIDCVRAN